MITFTSKMESKTNTPERVIGLFGATSIGVAAIIGGGILALAGTAFSSAGPSAAVAIALNGVIALLAAMSFAELSTAFPQSGGAYVFANKVLSIRAAFGVGWVLWFAYIVACVLYALGFAAFSVLLLQELCAVLGWPPPSWLSSHATMVLFAAGATFYFVLMLIRHGAGGGHWINVAKIAIFAVLIIVGAAVMVERPVEQVAARLSPFFSGGLTGLIHAMVPTFVLLHGFEVIAAVGGEIKDPGKTIPRAMFLSLAISLAVYVPLLFVVAAVGVPTGVSLAEFSAQHGETVIAAAVREYMGSIGYWLVISTAILAFLSALRANLMAGSRIALSMALDHALPTVLAGIDEKRKTPVMATYATGLAVVAVLFVLPDIETAGAAASLIFLLSFALAHITAYLARKRAQPDTQTYQAPWFPLIPALGVVSCTALGVFEAITVPNAGAIALMWFGFGAILYFAVFGTHAEIVDASAEAIEPRLGHLRGKSPLILVPIANPANARSHVEVANALAPSKYARVLLLSVVAPSEDPLSNLGNSQKIIAEALGVSLAAGFLPDALISVSGDSWTQIRRVAQFYECDNLLLGFGHGLSDTGTLSQGLEELINDLDCDVTIMRAPEGWCLADAKRIVVLVGGQGEEHKLRARVLGSLCRISNRDVHFVTVLSATSSVAQCENARVQVNRLAQRQTHGTTSVEVIRDDDLICGVQRATADADLVILGLNSVGRRRKVMSRISLAIANEASCAALLLSSKRSLI